MEEQRFENGLILKDGFLKLGSISWSAAAIKTVKIVRRPWLLKFLVSASIGAVFFKVAVQQIVTLGVGAAMPMIVATCIFAVWVAAALRRRGLFDVYISKGKTPKRVYTTYSEAQAVSIKESIEQSAGNQPPIASL